MLYLIGLGVDWKDLSLKAVEALHRCDLVYLEGYTSVSNFSVLQLEKLIGKKVKVLDRKQVEEEEQFLKDAEINDVALLVYGDPLSATTHTELLMDAKTKVEVIHAPSIFSAVAETGLQLYKFGKVGSIPFWKSESFFDVLEQNQKIGAHTLFLLDLNPEKEEFLRISDAINKLLAMRLKFFTENTMCVGCARLGTRNSKIVYGSAKELLQMNFGKPPYCLIIPTKLHFAEEDFLKKFFVNK